MIAGIGLGNSTMNLLAMSTMLGFCNTLDSLCSQAIGAGRNDIAYLQLNRARFILTLLYVPVGFLICHADSILLSLGQDADVTRHAQDYMIAFMPGLMLFGYTDAHRRFLTCHGYTTLPFIALLCSSAIHVSCSYHFIMNL